MKTLAVVAALVTALVAVGDEAEPCARLRRRTTDEISGSNWTIGCETLDRELAKFSSYRDFLPLLGIKRIRLQGGWARCERKKGVYDFSWLDEPVDFCRRHGLEVLLETSYGNPIYEGAGGWDLGAGFPKSEEGLAAWDRWVEALAKHFKGRVTDWAMWNEPDLRGAGRVEKTPEEIGAFNVRTASIIKGIIPEARISALSLAHNDPELLRACLTAMKGHLDLFDSVIYHGYSANPDDSYPSVERQKKVLAELAPHLHLVQGENGAPSTRCSAYALRDIDWNELSQAKWDLRRMLGDLGHDVKSSLFTIIEYTQAKKPLNTKGILGATSEGMVASVKPAFGAVQNLVSVFDDSLVRVRDSQAKLAVPRGAAFEYTSPKGRVLSYWDASARPDETLHPVTATLTVPGERLCDPVLVDLLTGEIRTASGSDGVYTVTVHDYPWLLAERAALPIAEKRESEDLATLIRRFTDIESRGDAVDAQSAAAHVADGAKARRFVAEQAADGNWPQVDYTGNSRSKWVPGTGHLQERTVFLAREYHRTKDAAFAAAVKRALDWWAERKLRCPNWWWNQIGAPQNFALAALMIDGTLTDADRARYADYLEVSQAGTFTGQNRVWIARIMMMRGLLRRDEALVDRAIGEIAGEVKYGQVEGPMSDGSFRQHGPQLQFGNYGASFIVNQARLADAFAGTKWAYPEEKLAILKKLLDDGYRWIDWKGRMDVAALGRQLTPDGPVRKAAVAKLARRELAEAGVALADEDPKGFRYFPKGAYAVYRAADWMASVKMQTPSVVETESWINGENTLGVHLSDGSLFVYATGKEYDNIFPLWSNWNLIPGVTAFRDAPIKKEGYRGDRGSNEVDEIATSEKDGTARLSFTLQRDRLRVRKHWTFSSDGIVASGTVERGFAPGKTVVTTVEHALAADNFAVLEESEFCVRFRNGAFAYTIDAPRHLIRVAVEERAGDYTGIYPPELGPVYRGKVLVATVEQTADFPRYKYAIMPSK